MTDGHELTSLSSHPSAAPAIRRAKAIGGLGGFVVAALIGFENGAPFAATVERALAVGVGCQLVVWAAAVVVWKRLLIAQAAAQVRAQTGSPGRAGKAE